MLVKTKAYSARRARIEAESERLREKIGYAGRNKGLSREGAATDAATFALLYESSDARFCLFETADRHLNAVNAIRLV